MHKAKPEGGQNYMYLRDRFGEIPLLDLDTGEVIHQADPESGEANWTQIVGHSGLRRQRLRRVDAATLEETLEFEPLSKDIFNKIVAYHAHENGWTYDWPHYQTEIEGEDPAYLEALNAALMLSARDLPYEMQIIGLQRRLLRYHSDGKWNTQRRFLRLVKAPHENPYDAEGNLREAYQGGPSLEAVMAYQSHKPYEGEGEKFVEGLHSRLPPLLYEGPAAVVRFLLDGQQPAFHMCRVYVRDDGHFICSDWCQRSGRDVKDKGGIDLQTAEYTFGTWVGGPCVKRAMDQGVFKPTSAVSKIFQMSRMKANIVHVPTFEEAYAKYEPAISKFRNAGLTDEQIVAKVEELVKSATMNFEVVRNLQGIPVTLDPKQFKPETLSAYADTYIDSVKSTPPFFYLPGYAKEPVAHVKPQYLVVDKERLLAKLQNPTGYPPLTEAELHEAEGRMVEHIAALQKLDRPLASCTWPIPEKV